VRKRRALSDMDNLVSSVDSNCRTHEIHLLLGPIYCYGVNSSANKFSTQLLKLLFSCSIGSFLQLSLVVPWVSSCFTAFSRLSSWAKAQLFIFSSDSFNYFMDMRLAGSVSSIRKSSLLRDRDSASSYFWQSLRSSWLESLSFSSFESPKSD